MARSRWRQRSDGVYQIGKKGRGRLRRAGVALGTVILAGAMTLAVVSAAAVYVVIGAPFLVAAAVAFLVVRRRRASRTGAPSAAVLTLARRKARVSVAARDAGA
jgi:hypothetical protein